MYNTVAMEMGKPEILRNPQSVETEKDKPFAETVADKFFEVFKTTYDKQIKNKKEYGWVKNDFVGQMKKTLDDVEAVNGPEEAKKVAKYVFTDLSLGLNRIFPDKGMEAELKTETGQYLLDQEYIDPEDIAEITEIINNQPDAQENGPAAAPGGN